MEHLELDALEEAALECVLGAELAQRGEVPKRALVNQALQELEPMLPEAGLAGVEAVFYRLLKDAKARIEVAADDSAACPN